MVAALLFIAQLDKPPLEAHSTLHGQDALNASIGTLGFHDGFGLTYRHLGPPSGDNVDAFLAAWAPFSFITVGAGVEYTRLVGDYRYVQGTVGLAFRPTLDLSLAIAYKPFTGIGQLQGVALNAWDIGLAWRPARWLATSIAIEAFNQPYVPPDFSIPRTYAIGVAVRPLRNDWLSIGFDARLRETSNALLWPAPRFTLDFRPLSWLGLLTAASVRGDFFVGLTLRERHVEAGGGIGLGATAGVNNSYIFARYASEAHEGLDLTGGEKTMQVGLGGDLRPSDGLWIFHLGKPPFGEIPLALHALADRRDVKAVRLVFQGFDCGLATLHEIRDAVKALRKKGKYVYAELGDADDKDLYVASAANEIIIEPSASLAFNGVKITLRTFKGTLDKIGARVEAEASGEYKNSPDAFTKDEPSKYQLEAQTALLDRFYETLIDAVVEGRKLPRKRVEELLQQGMFSAWDAKKAGLVDTLAHDPDPASAPAGSRYRNLWNVSKAPARDEWNEPPIIALIQIKGTITGGESFEDPFGLFPIAGARSIVQQLEQARADNNVKAVVVRIDSPGGDILASDFIYQAMRRMKGTKPLIVSMGDIAASGGYYAALPADVIFAQPETVTGSIGVFAFKIDLSGLFDKIGLKNTVLTRGPHADMFDVTRSLTGDEHKLLHDFVQKEYVAFIQKVAHARKMTQQKADSLARGRVWSGQAAHDQGLVDKLGGVVAAIAEAKRRAGYEATDLLRVRALPDAGFVAEVQTRLGLGGMQHFDLAELAAWVSRVQQALSAKAMYLFPYRLDVD